MSAPSNRALDDLVTFVSDQRKRRDSETQAKQLKELKAIVQTLRKCCRRPQFEWPQSGDLKRLNELISTLVRKVRKRQPPVGWKAYKAVDDHWHLNLINAIEQMVCRASQNTPPRPLDKYEALLSHPTDAIRTLAVDLFNRYRAIRRGVTRAERVDWQRFEPVFIAAREGLSASVPLYSRLGRSSSGSISLVAYACFLELFCDDLLWTGKHWAGALALVHWITHSLHRPELLEQLSRFLVPDSGRNLEAFTAAIHRCCA